ncbi:MAG: hypothetical protein HKM07_03005 [Chlamydiae bacterium]|nr:hypothetical protein [Chlamydiota bacterium]
MAKSKKPDINDILLKGHKRGILKAIDTACRTNTSLIVQKDDKIVAIKPKYKYIRVPIKAAKKKVNLSRRKAKSKN